MKPFDLQEALNGAPINVYGEKCYVLKDVTDLLDSPEETRYLVVFPSNHTDAELWTEDCFEGSSMWEEPELTSEQVLEKAYQEDLKVSLDGQDVYIIIGKAKDGSYLLGSEKNDSYVAWCVDFGEPKIYREDIVEPSPKSDTITVTLPKPFKPKPNEKFWFIDKVGADLQVSCKIKSNHALTSDGNYFASKADAQAWLDAMKSALDD
jgi:hypothetical protein